MITEEGNILIADFMGKKFTPYKGNRSYDIELSYSDCENWIIKHGLDSEGYKPELGWGIGTGKYNESWSWLMPVVEKIESIQFPSPSMIKCIVEIKSDSCRIFKGEWNEDKEGFISYVSYDGNEERYTKIQATWLCVVDFIKFINEQK